MFERQDQVIACINIQVNSHKYLFSFQITVFILLEDFLYPTFFLVWKMLECLEISEKYLFSLS